MKIDVIIPVYEPTEKLKKLLRALVMQTVRPVQIMLVHTEDGQDISYAKELCGEIPVKGIKVRKADFDHGGTRDMAIRKVQSEIVLLMTQDAIPADRKLLEHLGQALHADDTVAVAYARQKAGKESDYIEQYTRQFNYPAESQIKSGDDLGRLGIKTYFCSNVCAAYKRDTYLQIGGFEKKIIFNEDMVFAAKAIEQGYKIAYVAEALVIHAHNYAYLHQFRRNFDQGVSQADYPQIFERVKSETEGIRLVKQTAIYLMKKRRPLQIIRLIALSGCKYIGFRIGKKYMKLPKRLVKKLSMNPEYWNSRGKQSEK